MDASEIRDRFGLAEPKPGAKLLRAANAGAPLGDPKAPASEIKRVSGEIKRGQGVSDRTTAPQAEGPLAGLPAAPVESDPAGALADRLAIEAEPAVGSMMDQIEAMLSAAGSMEEFRAMLLAGFPKISTAALVEVLARAMVTADAVGRITVDSGD